MEQRTDLIEMLASKSDDANSALALGDFDTYLAIINPAPDCLLMSPFGGPPLHGYDTSPAGRARIAGMFRNGSFCQEFLTGYSTDELVVLVTVERMMAEIGGQAMQEWALRVSQVFRRTDDEWQLVHRHADPLAHGVPPARGAKLARGDDA